MKAIVRDDYGSASVLKFEDIDRPAPEDDEVLVRVRASSLNRGDRYAMQGTPWIMRLILGLSRPKKRGMGQDFAGDIVEVGKAVTDVRPGQAVYGEVDFGDTWAEYACIPAALVAPKPKSLSYAQAAAVPVAGLTALQGLRTHAKVTKGQRVLINGATGAVGTFAVQIAKALGAADVVGVCSERHIDLVHSLGADHVIPYESEDFLACGRTFDVFFDVVGNRSLRRCCKLLHPSGVYVSVGAPEGGRVLGPARRLFGIRFLAMFVKPKIASYTAKANRDDLVLLTELIESGSITPAIDHEFPLAQTADAMRHLITAHPASKLVLTI